MPQSIRLIDIGQLSEQTADVLRLVDEDGEIIDVTDGGRVLARLIPLTPPDATPTPLTPEMRQAILERHLKLAEDIGRAWKDDVSAVDAVREMRRTR